MSHARTITLGERLPGMRSCAARPETGRCSCGWQAPAGLADVEPAAVRRMTLSHLYADLTGPARRFAWPEENR